MKGQGGLGRSIGPRRGLSGFAVDNVTNCLMLQVLEIVKSLSFVYISPQVGLIGNELCNLHTAKASDNTFLHRLCHSLLHSVDLNICAKMAPSPRSVHLETRHSR